MSPLILTDILVGRLYYSQFSDEETSAHKAEVTSIYLKHVQIEITKNGALEICVSVFVPILSASSAMLPELERFKSGVCSLHFYHSNGLQGSEFSRRTEQWDEYILQRGFNTMAYTMRPD